MYFDGSDDKVTTTFSSNKLSSDFSIGIWFKSNGINNANVFDMILDYSNTEFLEFFLEGGGGCSACATGTFVGSVNEGGSNSTLNYTTKSTTRVDDNAWHHAVLTREASSGALKIYIDGALYDVTSSGTGTIDNGHFTLGVRASDQQRWFKGYMDDLAIWSDDLTAAEVQAQWLGQGLIQLRCW